MTSAIDTDGTPNEVVYRITGINVAQEKLLKFAITRGPFGARQKPPQEQRTEDNEQDQPLYIGEYSILRPELDKLDQSTLLYLLKSVNVHLAQCTLSWRAHK